MVVKTESFEGVTTTPNSPNYNGDEFWHRPGFNSVYEFASGLRFVDPVPNTDVHDVWTGDFTTFSPNSEWFEDTDEIANAGDVPFGKAYIGAWDYGGSMTFGFDTKVYKVGGYVTGYDFAQLALTAYDKNGHLITGASIKSVLVDDWGTNYIQVISKKPIDKVVFTGDYIVLDGLKFDTSKPDKIKGNKDGGKVNGTHADDLMIGKKGDDKFKAKAGDDTLFGKAGNDKLHGQNGNDTLNGGTGHDKLWGEKGQDSFVFDTVATQDTLKDFNPVDDTILLSKAAFTALSLGQLPSDQFVVGNAALDANDHILYDQASGRLYYDADGVGGVAPVEVAKLPAGLAVTHEDFFVA